MKYIKTYEKWLLPFFNNKVEPKIGDYVICKYIRPGYSTKDLEEFIDNNIGTIIKKRKPIRKIGEKLNTIYYHILYNNIPNNIIDKNFFKIIDEYNIKNGKDSGYLAVEKDEIINFSKNKEDLEILLDTNKYNL